MKKSILSSSRFFAGSAMLALLLWTSCSSPRLSQISQAEAENLATAKTERSADDQLAPLAAEPVFEQNVVSQDLLASTSPDVSQQAAAASSRPVMATQASTREVAAANKTLNNYVATLKKESRSKKGIGNKLAALPAKMAIKSVVKKIEKAEKRLDVKKAEKAKAGKALDPTIRTGIIVAAVGLLLIIVAGIAGPGSGLIYSIGGIALTVGLVVILLAALDVI